MVTNSELASIRRLCLLSLGCVYRQPLAHYHGDSRIRTCERHPGAHELEQPRVYWDALDESHPLHKRMYDPFKRLVSQDFGAYLLLMVQALVVVLKG